MSVSSAKIDWWINNNQNILFVGRHGVGKTAMIKEAFDRHKLNWKYFSASTMDPWVDFVGVPKEKVENELPESFRTVRELAKISRSVAINYVMQNWHIDAFEAEQVINHCNKAEGTTYLELVRPYTFASGEVEALFFDEFNRSPKKIRNAVMELIQFGSVNGHKFPKLRFVWAAINPEDDEQLKYDVESCDPAHLDRFHCSVQIPYMPNADWFREKYGQRVADSAIQWWDALNDETKRLISPRRLQYAMDVYVNKGDIRDVLPVSSNVMKLTTMLKNGPITEALSELFASRDDEKTTKFLENENNFSAGLKFILGSPAMMDYFVPLMPEEKITSLMSSEEAICQFVIKNIATIPTCHKVARSVLSANLDANMSRKIRRALTEDSALAKAFAQDNITPVIKTVAPHYNKNKVYFDTELARIEAMPLDSSPQRIMAYENIVKLIPKELNTTQAVKTLVLLDKIFSSKSKEDKWKFSSIILDPAFNRLFGVINHCLMEIHRNTTFKLSKILTEGSLPQHIGGLELFKKIWQAGQQSKLPDENFNGD